MVKDGREVLLDIPCGKPYIIYLFIYLPYCTLFTIIKNYMNIYFSIKYRINLFALAIQKINVPIVQVLILGKQWEDSIF